MKIVVLGGTGFIGPYVVRHLVEMGQTVAILHTGAHEPDLPPEVEHLHDLSARSPLASVPREAVDWEPEVVVHMVPIGEADARVAVDAFRGVARRIVAVSSADVYRAMDKLRGVDDGPPDPTPLTEGSPLRERFYPYRGDTPKAEDDSRRWTDDYDKILVERAVMSAVEIEGTVLRLPMVYGPGDRQHRLHPYLKRIEDGRAVIPLDEGVAGWRTCRGYVEDVAWAVALAATDERAAGRIYNVSELTSHREEEWVRLIGEAAGWRGQVVRVPEGKLPAGLNAAQHLSTDSSRIRDELGYSELIAPDEALRRTVEWERANSPEQVDPADFDYGREDEVLSELGKERG
jgi:nucleoside-diphosphate-sugar epimerase